jgi:hypothetical protein
MVREMRIGYEKPEVIVEKAPKPKGQRRNNVRRARGEEACLEFR